MRAVEPSLARFRDCPGRKPDGCAFGTAPAVEIDTGHPLAPHVTIWRCQTCGHGVTRPAMPDVTALYAGRESQDFLARDSGWVERLKWRVFSSQARQLLAWCKEQPRLIADFGAGNGMLARCLAEQAGPASDVFGLDFFDEPPADLSPARYLGFAAAEHLRGRIDLLTCFHVLEHDDDPHAMLARLIGFVRPGGTLVIEVPNIDCVWTPWFGAACANWYAPYHRVHFSRASLSDLVRGHGLEIISQQDICGPTFALSLAGLFGVRPNSALFALAAGLRPLQWLAEKLTRRPSALRIIAQVPQAG